MRNSRSSKTAAAATALLLAGAASAAEISISVNAGPDAVPLTFNPRSVNGLLPAASAGYSFTGARIQTCATGFTGTITTSSTSTAAAAGYGSDISFDNRYTSPLLVGTAVEPMADVQAAATVSREAQCFDAIGTPVFPSLPFQVEIADASVSGSVNHRVVSRPQSSALGADLDLLLDIPVRLDYALSASTAGTTGSGASAFASFRLTSDAKLLFSEIANCPARGCQEEASGSWSTLARRSTGEQEVLYTIQVSADAYAVPRVQTFGSAEASAQAVADPFLYIDPDWEYAQYFMVQQESVANPGGWAEVTRGWRSTVVPAPGALWLGLSACATLLPWVRRRSGTTGRQSPGS